MGRYVQQYDPEAEKYVLVPADEAARKAEGMEIHVRGDFQPMRSPIDGSVIHNHRQYADHCRKHDVVPAQEFNQEYFARKAKERERLYRGEYTPQEKLQRKREIWETIHRMERQA